MSSEEPVVSSVVTRNKEGTEDVVLTAGGTDGPRLAQAIEAAATALLAEHSPRDAFSGHLQIVILPITPRAERQHLPAMLERLRGVCKDLSGEFRGAFRVSLTYQADPARKDAAPSAPEPRPAATAARQKADAARLVAAVATGRPPRSSGPSPYWKLLPVLPAVIGAIAIYWMTRPPYSFPDKITFGEAELSRAGAGHDDEASGAVYILPGETMPGTPLQVGVMVSKAHPTAADLLAWTQQRFRSSDSSGFYDTITGNERCLVGINPAIPRHFVALQLCGTGSGLAACVESDLRTNRRDIDECESDEACLAALCDARWEEERASIEAVLKRFAR